jgi:hypothetical protein
MKHLLVGAFLSTGLITTPIPEWVPIGATKTFSMQVDVNSLSPSFDGGWQIAAQVKVTPDTPLTVPDKKKLGTYFIEEFVVYCKDDYLLVKDRVLYSADGDVLYTGYSGVKLRNSHLSNDVMSRYIDLICDDKPTKSKHRLVV